MKTTALIDGDIVAYTAASVHEEVLRWPGCEPSVEVDDFAEVKKTIGRMIEEWRDAAGCEDAIVCLSVPNSEGWRRTVLPTYKANRKGRKPVHLQAAKDYLLSDCGYRSYLRPTLEADDVMGILSTHPNLLPGKKVIVSTDKDMKTIPGFLFNPAKDTFVRKVERDEADYWHLYQTLVGDATDGYAGCPGMGPAKAEAILFGSSPPWSSPSRAWSCVVSAFKSKGLTEEDALVQARVARICRHTDYDYTKKEVKLWTPSRS